MVGSEKSESSAAPSGVTSVKDSAPPVATRPSRARPDIDVAALVGKGLNLLASLVRLVCLLVAVLLVVFVIMYCFDANPANPYTMFVGTWGQKLNLGLDTLFRPAEPKFGIVVNYGIAVIVWLIIGAVVGKVLRRG